MFKSSIEFGVLNHKYTRAQICHEKKNIEITLSEAAGQGIAGQ